MKKLLFPLAFFASFMGYSQVGVKTETPQRTLHVNGSLQVVNELNVGGDAVTAGNAGVSGQVLRSNGPGISPTWDTFDQKEVYLVSYGANSVDQLPNFWTQLNRYGNGQPLIQDTNYVTTVGFGASKIMKAGYYRILTTTQIDVTGAGTATSRILKNGTTTGTLIGMSQTPHAAGVTKVYHTVAAGTYLAAGDTIYVTISDTQIFYAGIVGAPFISITYLGK